MFKLVVTKQELRANVSAFSISVAALIGTKCKELDALANGCSHAVEWVAFADGAGGWEVAFSKYAGYNGVTPTLYDQYRQSHLTGTDTKRRVEKFGGTLYGVGLQSGIASNHPAVDKVRAICTMLGKTPKLTAKVRVFPDDHRPATMDVLVAAIRAADLNDNELAQLFGEVRQVC